MLSSGSKRMQRIDYAIDNVRKAMKAQEIERLTQQRARRLDLTRLEKNGNVTPAPRADS